VYDRCADTSIADINHAIEGGESGDDEVGISDES